MELNSTEDQERKFQNINTFLYWSGYANKPRSERNKYIFKALKLDKYCTDPWILEHFSNKDKNKDFFRQYKKDAEFCKYACKQIMMITYNDLLSNKYDKDIADKLELLKQ